MSSVHCPCYRRALVLPKGGAPDTVRCPACGAAFALSVEVAAPAPPGAAAGAALSGVTTAPTAPHEQVPQVRKAPRADRRWMWWVFALGASVAGLVGLYRTADYLRPWDRIGPFTYYRIRLGMTQQEVQAIIGLPPSSPPMIKEVWFNFTERGLPSADLQGLREDWPGVARDGRTITLQRWAGDLAVIRVAFDQGGKVVGVYMGDRLPR